MPRLIWSKCGRRRWYLVCRHVHYLGTYTTSSEWALACHNVQRGFRCPVRPVCPCVYQAPSLFLRHRWGETRVIIGVGGPWQLEPFTPAHPFSRLTSSFSSTPHQLGTTSGCGVWPSSTPGPTFPSRFRLNLQRIAPNQPTIVSRIVVTA